MRPPPAEASCDVHRVAGDETLACARVTCDDLPGIDAGTHGQPDTPVTLELVVQHGLRALHVGGRAHRPQRVVLMKLRQDELLHNAAVPLELGLIASK